MPDLYFHCQYCGKAFKAICTHGEFAQECRDHEAMCEKNLVNDKLKGVKVGDVVDVSFFILMATFHSVGVVTKIQGGSGSVKVAGKEEIQNIDVSVIQSITRLVPEVKLDESEKRWLKNVVEYVDETFGNNQPKLEGLFKKLGVEV